MAKTAEKVEVKTVAYRVPVSLCKRLKLTAAAQGCTMSSIVIEAIEAAVELYEEQQVTAA